MTNKAYIVVNEQQESEVLDNLEREGLVWTVGGEKPTEYTPSDTGKIGKATFPYVLINRGDVRWSSLNKFDNDATVIYDGRSEENMSDKYVVSQEFMNELEEWKDEHETELEVSLTKLIDPHEVTYLATIVDDWWLDSNISNIECNNRLIAIIRWVNGEDVFEVEKPKKWVVRSKEIDSTYCYAQLLSENNNTLFMAYSFANATRFDTKEEAESWANSHQEVIEVDG